MAPTVLGALRQFLPDFLKTSPALSIEQRRAIWAINHCRTSALGGRAFACDSRECNQVHFAWHSCNHKACPQCGRAATARWVQRELAKLVNAPYFLVTFTLPSQLRCLFFGPLAKDAFDLFFTAVSRALSEKLATDKGLRATVSGFTAALHTWNQLMAFHPHIHCLVPGAGLDHRGRLVRVKKPDFLVYLPNLQSAFREHMRDLLRARNWQVDPDVWRIDWGVHIQPAGNGASALKYLSTYVARSVITDARILEITHDSVTFRWKNRDANNRLETRTLPGIEFVTRYLRHVLPRGLRSVRYYGFGHPAAKRNRLRVQLFSGRSHVQLGDSTPVPSPTSTPPLCPVCHQPMRLVLHFQRSHRQRGPPSRRPAAPNVTAPAITTAATPA
jgi:Putative transposase/Transposase zinc-binding domain